jgi:hypothetical protein
MITSIKDMKICFKNTFRRAKKIFSVQHEERSNSFFSSFDWNEVWLDLQTERTEGG